MSKEIKYYVYFDSKRSAGHYAEIIADSPFDSKEYILQAVKKYYRNDLYGKFMSGIVSIKQIFNAKEFNTLKKSKAVNNYMPIKTCSEKIYLPLLEDIKIENREPFLSKPRPLAEEVNDFNDFLKKSKFEKSLFEKQITLQELSQATGIAYPILIDLKKGRKKNYRARTLRDIAAYLDVEVDDII